LQPAYDAFVESVKAYPFSDSGFAQLTRTSGLSDIFTSSSASSTKQLGVIIDRVTYIGTCELFVSPDEVSLRRPLESCGHNADIIGAILERQIEGLEGSSWKEGVRNAVKALLVDAVAVYPAGDIPVRRARVLIRCLEFGYKAGDNGLPRHSDDIGEEAEDLLARDVGFSSFLQNGG
jgi:separase